LEKWIERREGFNYTQDDEAKCEENMEFQYRIDRGRLTGSSAFRRLQGKTQVLTVGEHDFFRNRLTHSLEVANIGVSISRRLHFLIKEYDREKSKLLPLIPPDALMQTICFAHDLGHPAFGHVGERILNYHMLEHGGFEGNGQTFRLLSKLAEYYPESGINPTRRTLLGVMKYPTLFTDAVAARQDPYQDKIHFQGVKECGSEYKVEKYQTPRNTDAWHPPKCLLDDDADVLEWVLKPLSDDDRIAFLQLDDEGKTLYKSFDCSIMELADDIAYGVHDLEDALAMGLVHRLDAIEKLRPTLEQLGEMRSKNPQKDFYIDLIKTGSASDLKNAITQIVSALVNCVKYEKNIPGFEEPLLSINAVFTQEASAIIKNLKKFVFKEVIATPSLRTLEYKGQRIISELFETINDRNNYKNLLPKVYIEMVHPDEKNLPRVTCDYIASMTDSEAGAMYERLFLPSAGSVFHPV
jgi:dGTPase